MTRKVHAYQNISSASTDPRRKIVRYECQGCGATYADEPEALNCELHHQALLKTMRGEPLTAANVVGEPQPATAARANLTRVSASDYTVAAAAMLRKYAERLERGVSASDIGPDVELLGRVMAHRT